MACEPLSLFRTDIYAVEFSGICDKVVARDIVMKPSWWVSETKEEEFSQWKAQEVVRTQIRPHTAVPHGDLLLRTLLGLSLQVKVALLEFL